jgi:nucleoid-associated protein EbfC
VGFGNLAKMAQQMQADMARVDQELASLTVEGSAGGGAVRAVATGKQELVSVTIDPGVVDPDDVEMLQDLVLAAVGDALAQARRAAEEKMARVTGGLRMPGLPGF